MSRWKFWKPKQRTESQLQRLTNEAFEEAVRIAVKCLVDQNKGKDGLNRKVNVQFADGEHDGRRFVLMIREIDEEEEENPFV